MLLILVGAAQLCQGPANVFGMTGSASLAAASTAAALASIIGPALCRPSGSAFMSIRHKQAVPKIRDVIKALFLHAAPVFTGLHATQPVLPRTTAPSLSTSQTSSKTDDDVSHMFDSPVSTHSGRMAPPKALSGIKNSPPASSPSNSPQSPSYIHKSSSVVNPAVHKALDALIFFAVRDYVNDSTSSPLAKSKLPGQPARSVHSPAHVQ